MKRALTDLAIFGGPAAFLHDLYVGRPTIGDRTRFFARLEWALNNNWLTNGGPLVREFEGRVADLADVRHCVATCNATVALQLVLRASDVSGEVIMPSMTFAATAHAASWLGLEPVFCDVDPETGLIDPDHAAALVSPRTGAIVGVHLWGRAAPVDALHKIAADKQVKLFFDAAHALGCTADGRAIGGFGDAEVFSFHATKTVTSFEGGAIVTDDGQLADRIRTMHNFGLSPERAVAEIGTNGKMSESAAAMGLTSLDAFAETRDLNRTNHALYSAELRGLRGISVHQFDARERNNYQYVIVSVDKTATGIDRDQMQAILRAEKVIAQPYFSPGCHQMPPYRRDPPVRLAHTEYLSEQVLALPTGPAVSSEDIRRVCDIVRIAVTNGELINAQWDQRMCRSS
ncbi:dTDP-4-dehydro-6-deoxyglucose aminotransferase [Rhodococcus sp. ABRD24]|uniref:dTDP-4-dehydro-6-deoxyglucose aminotransferase n=1 Tax=Rhodococcus sp. ABRD24 TaxID=2507582 RepID=UPI00103EEBC7|nr:dTDP-4-dehydro-6-deoxyglucose aminotransferase [Rhodococcus sp. ABRD24]QBJ96223.1 dTDP-4-dehydro-6-deoxyglucose aminotransferase [Rhodococcus sp. ABRD24]